MKHKIKKASSGKTEVSRSKVGTLGLVDTYRILFTDGSSFDYTVVNGSNGTDGTDGTDGSNGIDGTDGESGGNNGKIDILSDTTLSSIHHGKRLLCYDNRNITIPTTLPANFWCVIVNKGTGKVSLLSQTGVTLEGIGNELISQYAEMVLVHEGSNVYSVAGKFD